MDNYLLIYNNDKIIYAGLQQDIKEMHIYPNYKFETFSNIKLFNKRIDEVTKNILMTTPDPMDDYIVLYDTAVLLKKISHRLYNNYFHILDFGKEEVKDFSNALERAAQGITNTLDDFCLLDKIEDRKREEKE